MNTVCMRLNTRRPSIEVAEELPPKPKVLVASRAFGRIVPDGIEILKQVCKVTRTSSNLPERRLIRAIADCDGLLVGMDRVTGRVMDASGRLMVIAKYGVGYDNIDVAAASERGIIVTYVPHLNSQSVAEHTFGLISCLSRKLVDADRATRRGEWRGLDFVGMELEGKKIGIIGLGEIGRRVARIAKGFGMQVLFYDVVHNEQIEREIGARYVDFHELLREADVVTIHTPLTDETVGMIGIEELKEMKPTVLLVNTARGRIVDEKALAKALREEMIAGAAIDVYEREPPGKGHPLFKLRNTALSPHIAAFTTESIRRMDVAAAEDLVAVIEDKEPKFMANPDVWSKRRRVRLS